MSSLWSAAARRRLGAPCQSPADESGVKPPHPYKAASPQEDDLLPLWNWHAAGGYFDGRDSLPLNALFVYVSAMNVKSENIEPDAARLRVLATDSVRRLQQAGHTAYWAGGGVRDMLRGGTPKDYDIATSATPDQVLAVFPNAVLVGKAFGVVRARVAAENGARSEFEIATFRQDHAYRDGRRPESVTFTDAETDAKRRDFTVNAMFYDPVADRLHDYVEGRADLDARLIRCVGDPDQRFAEDYLRMLRAVRFGATLDFAIEPATAEAIKRHAHLITGISAERIREELTRILLESAQPGDVLVVLDELSLLKQILPEIEAMKGMEQPARFHPEGDVFRHTVEMLNLMANRPAPGDAALTIREEDRVVLAYAVLLHDVGKPPTVRVAEDRIRFDGHSAIGAEMGERILARLRFSGRETDAVVHCIRDHMRFMHVRQMRQAKLRALVGAPTFPVELELHRLDCLSSHGDLANHDFLVKFRAELKEEPALPAPWITGHDIMKLGVPEGREVGEWRKKAYDAQLESRFPDRAALLAWIEAEMRTARDEA